MRGFLLLFIALWVANNMAGQEFSAKDFLFASSLSSKKFESYLNRKNFISSGKTSRNDIVVNLYNLKAEKKKKRNDDSLQYIPIKKSIEACFGKDNVSFTYFTSVKDEFDGNIHSLKDIGFFCGNEKDTVAAVYQKKNMLVEASTLITEENDTLYSLKFSQAELPSPDKIEYAEDLLLFQSHEFLVSVFGEKNVTKDVYYFSENEIAKCTVLFPKTSRQAVFIWNDQLNLCKPSFVIVGGGTKVGGLASYDGVIGENVWASKDGIYPGMSVNSLVHLNRDSFKFYGRNTSSAYTILPDNAGALNFKTNKVMLGCLNPTGSKLLNNATVNVDDVLSDNLGMYVLMIMVFPSK